eukprot:7835-Eustigmatos_ZCMA.PRE.1
MHALPASPPSEAATASRPCSRGGARRTTLRGTDIAAAPTRWRCPSLCSRLPPLPEASTRRRTNSST